MKYPYLLSSDQHCHAWSAFSKVNPDGVNSRLRIILNEIERSYAVLRSHDGELAFLAGDLFHVRGEIKPSVFNPTVRAFEEILTIDNPTGRECVDVQTFAIPGNHDLEGKEATSLGNAMQALSSIPGFNVCTEPTTVGDVVVFPWFQDLNDLRRLLKEYADPTKDAIIHAPVNGVIKGIPNHGLEARELAAFGYRRVFAGHYHDHKVFEDGKVISIGATTHQTWGDPGTTAGFLLVYEDRIEHFASQAPKFIDLNKTDDGTLDGSYIEDFIPGNYAKIKLDDATEKELRTWREDLLKHGALGVIVTGSKKASVTRSGAGAKAAISLHATVSHYIEHDMKPLLTTEVTKMALEVLDEARA